MKNYRHILFAFVLCYLSTTLLAQQNEGYLLKGKVLHDFDGYIYLFTEQTTDSTKVTDRQFSFAGKVDYTTEVRLRTKDGYTTKSIYLDNSLQQVEVSIQNNVTYVKSLKGNKTQTVLDELSNLYETNGERDDFPELIYKKLESVILANPKSQFTGELLSDIIMDPFFSFEESMSLYTKMDTTTQTRESIRSLKISLNKLKNTRIGNTLPDFSLSDENGRPVNLSDFKGKVVLVEF